MEMVEILMLATGWLFVSCAIARVLGGACDIGQTSAERPYDLSRVSDSPGAMDDDTCVGLILERAASTPTGFFPVLFASAANDGAPVQHSAPALQAAPLQIFG
jgi:hypothetical protein